MKNSIKFRLILKYLFLSGLLFSEIFSASLLANNPFQTNSTQFTISLTSSSNETLNTIEVPVKSLPPTVSITSPKNNTSFNTAWVNVCGTFTGNAVKQITCNGMPAFIIGNTFEAIDVPLTVGTNTITTVAQDWDLANILLTNDSTTDTNKAVALAQGFDGRMVKAFINIIGVTNVSGNLEDNILIPVQAQAEPSAGFTPLKVTFQVQASVPGQIQQVFYDFNGDGIADQTNSDLRPVTHTYTSYDDYYPLVTVQTTAGRFSSVSLDLAIASFGSIRPLFVYVQRPPILLSTIRIDDPVDIKWTSTSNFYVLSGSTATITEFTDNGKRIRSLKGIGTNPSGFDVDAKGNVYVAVTASNQVLKFKPAISSFEPDATFGNNGFIGNKDGRAGSDSNQFNAPFGVAVSPDGSGIAVSDSGNSRIQYFTKDGMFTYSSDAGNLNHPKGLAYGGEMEKFLFVADSGNDRIVVSGIGLSGTNGTSLGQFREPWNVCHGTRGFYVADTANNRIQKFAPVSRGEMSSATPFFPEISLSREIGLKQPKAVAAVEDPITEKFYIADTGNNRVILVELPVNGPESVWNEMKAHLLANDIQGAMFYFNDQIKALNRSLYLPMSKGELFSEVNNYGPIQPVSVGNENAEYFFDYPENKKTNIFHIYFKRDNGIWKISSF